MNSNIPPLAMDHKPFSVQNHRRTRQACINCRRKKVRCDGIRPVCSSCARLNRTCLYAGSDRDKLSSKQSHGTASLDALYSRISRLESVLLSSVNNPGPAAGTTNQDSLLLLPSARTGTAPLQKTLQSSMQTSVNSDYSNTGGTSEHSSVWSACNLDPQTLNRLLDAYFLNCHNQPYSFFHEASLRQKAAYGLVPDSILSAISAISLRFANVQAFTGIESHAAHSFARNSWMISSQLNMDCDGECGLESVQSTTLLAIFDFIEGKQRSAWVKLGLAVRLAQALNLPFEPPQELSFAEQEERRRTFWSVYLLDRLFTCGRARPPAFDDSLCTVRLPCSESSFREDIAEQTERLSKYIRSEVPDPPEPSPFARVVIVASVLSKCSQYAIQGSEADSKIPPWDSGSEFQKISSALLYLESQLQFQRPLHEALGHQRTESPNDHHSTGPVVISYAMYHLCHCLLYHFYLLRQKLGLYSINPPYSFIRQILLNNQVHAVGLSHVLRKGLEIGCGVRASFLGYCCLMSGMVHAVNRGSDHHELRQRSQQYLDFSMQFLGRSALFWPNSIKMYHALRDFQEISTNYRPFMAFSGTRINIAETYAEKMAYLTDYGSLSSQRREQNGKPCTTEASAFLDDSAGVLSILGDYQPDVDVARAWSCAVGQSTTTLLPTLDDIMMEFGTQTVENGPV